MILPTRTDAFDLHLYSVIVFLIRWTINMREQEREKLRLASLSSRLFTDLSLDKELIYADALSFSL